VLGRRIELAVHRSQTRSVSLGDGERNLRFVTASNATITEVERVQELAQNGRCVEAYHHGVEVHSTDLRIESRWPELVPDALRLGLRSVVALPMRFGEGDTLGTLNVYDARTRERHDDEIQPASLLADVAVSYVTNASELERSERIREQSQRALQSRIIIEQPKGMIAADLGLGMDEAFKRLPTPPLPQRHLHSVSEAVVNLGLRLT
jgi:GAF domain-containing protein